MRHYYRKEENFAWDQSENVIQSSEDTQDLGQSFRARVRRTRFSKPFQFQRFLWTDSKRAERRKIRLADDIVRVTSESISFYRIE